MASCLLSYALHQKGQSMQAYFLRNLSELAQKKAIIMREEAQLWDIFSRDLKREAGRYEEAIDRRKPIEIPREILSPEPHQEKLLLKISEAVKLMGISRSTLYKEINEGRIKIRKAGRRTLIAYTDLKDWFAKLPS